MSQRFDITLSNIQLTMVNRYNAKIESWVIDILDGVTGQLLIPSMPLVTGIDLLGQYKYLGIPGQLIVSTIGDFGAVPNLENLGKQSNLFYVIEQ